MPGSAPRDAIMAVLSGALAREVESDRLDFKTVGRSREDSLVDLAEAAACLANSRGGHIIVGIKDSAGGPEAFVGCDLDNVRTQRRIYELTNPGLIVTVTTEIVAGASLSVIAVPRSPDVHQVKGRATERVGTSCEPMSSARIAAVLADRRADDWSDADSDVTPAQIAARAEEDVRARLMSATDPERQARAGLSLVDIIRRLGLLSPAGTLTHAGEVLLVGRAGSEIHYTHRRTRSGQLTTNERLQGLDPGTGVDRCREDARAHRSSDRAHTSPPPKRTAVVRRRPAGPRRSRGGGQRRDAP